MLSGVWSEFLMLLMLIRIPRLLHLLFLLKLESALLVKSLFSNLCLIMSEGVFVSLGGKVQRGCTSSRDYSRSVLEFAIRLE